jgi:7-carboxy-7-deazaguanine synthase
VLRVCEIFHSIQGESSYAGWPCSFVRLSGCNLRCRYCDTPYAYEEGVAMEVGEILERLGIYSSRLVEVTGGEPLLQAETPRLVRKLLECGYRVLVETNGSKDISGLDPRCVAIVDMKCPSSGQSHCNDLGNLRRLRPSDELKFVIENRADYDFAKSLLSSIRSEGEIMNTVHFSPVFGQLDPSRLVDWILEDGLWVHLNMQWHKVIWGPDERGV